MSDNERLASEPYHLIWDDTEGQIGTYDSPEAAYDVVRRLIHIYHDDTPPMVLVHVEKSGVIPCADGKQLIEEAMEDERSQIRASLRDGNTTAAPSLGKSPFQLRHPDVPRRLPEHPSGAAHAVLRARQSTGQGTSG